MQYFKITFLSFSIFLIGCTAGVKTVIDKKYPPLNNTDVVKIYEVEQQEPKGLAEIGTVKIYDSGFTTNCDYTTVVNTAKNEARKAGGNVLKITVHKKPGFSSSCHQIVATILKTESLNDSLQADTVKYSDNLKNTGADYAIPKNDVVGNANSLISKWRFAASYGWSSRIAKTDPNASAFVKEYIDALKTGNHLELQLTYYPSSIGVGLLFNNFYSSNSVLASATSTSGTTYTGELSDKINIMMIAPAFCFRGLYDNSMNELNMSIGLGYVHYTDIGKFMNEVKLSGNSFGMSYGVNYDYGLSRNFAIGIGLSLKLGLLTSYELEENNQTTKVELDKDHYENLSRVDFSIGVRFR